MRSNRALYIAEAFRAEPRECQSIRERWKCGCDEAWVDRYQLNHNGGVLDLRELRARTEQSSRNTSLGLPVFSNLGEILEVVIKPQQLRGFHNNTEMKQSYIMAAVGREAADFDMSHEDAKQLCLAMIENLFGGTIHTLSHLEIAFFHGYKKHLGYDAVHERVLMRRGVHRKR